VESELFGYERGAFSGALASKPGLLETARGGTVLLDEIGDLAASGQAKLLRALETGRITRLGDVRERPIDIRIVAATNRDLEADVAQGRFRQDLLFRLGAAKVVLPPLRDRPREIPLLAQAFLDEAASHYGRKPMSFSIGALHELLARPWKGNVRELRNLARLLVATVPDDVVQTWHLRESAAPEAARAEAPAAPAAPEESTKEETPPAAFKPVGEELRDLERRRMEEALEVSGGQQKKAAQLLGMPLRTFTLKMKKYGLQGKHRPK
jgi:DNA-binding NtrC family response regulator